MYQSNQAGIEKEIPSCSAVGNARSGRPSLALAPLACEQYPRYCSAAGTVVRQPPALPSTLASQS